jgi:inward rectifier potassium channel
VKNNEDNNSSWRLLNRDGTFNVARRGRRVVSHDSYHSLLSLNWQKFLLLLVFTYVVINTTFAILYVACGDGALSGISQEGFLKHFSDAFFFSVQTFSTIGYGKITPESIPANLLVTIEALTGLLSVALATGLIFARFSRPTARVLFSEVAVIDSHDATPSFIFRMANQRQNQIYEATVKVVMSISEMTKEGVRFRTFYDLKLERSMSPLFALTWTIVHPIEKDSPLFGKSKQDLIDAEVEILVTMTGLDETFSQTVHARFSYIPKEIRWNKKFADMLGRNDGLVTVDMSRMHLVEESKLPQLDV